MHPERYKVLKECIYKVSKALEQPTKSYLRKCLMSAKYLNGSNGDLLHPKHYKVLKECIYKVLEALEQATQSFYLNCPMLAKVLTTASHLQPKCRAEWLKL